MRLAQIALVAGLLGQRVVVDRLSHGHLAGRLGLVLSERLLQVALAEDLTLQGAELAGLLLGGACSAALLLSLGLGGLGGGLDTALGHHRDRLGLALLILARNLDRSRGRLDILGLKLLERKVILGRDANQKLAIALGNQGAHSVSEGGGHLFCLVNEGCSSLT